MVLAAVSPWLSSLLLDSLDWQAGDWVRDEYPVLYLPDVTVAQMQSLLSLLYTGTASLHQTQLAALVTLTHLLKLVSLPVVIDETPTPAGTKRRGRPVKEPVKAVEVERASLTFLPHKYNIRGRPAKILTTSLPTDSKLDSTLPSDFLGGSTKETRAGNPVKTTGLEIRTLNTRTATLGVKTTGLEVQNVSNAESDGEELVEEMQVIVSNEGHVERLEMIRNDNKKDKIVREVGIVPIEVSEAGQAETATVTVVQTEEGEGLDNLISVAEAFERSQQPDFNDIASPVVDGTDTEKHLVRNCCICNKSLLGRNALSRHMRNVHPTVFGPYKCSFSGCGKMIESGPKMLTHMYHHTTVRTADPENNQIPQKEESEPEKTVEKPKIKEKFMCNARDETCSLEFEFAKDLDKHMVTVHNMKPWLCDVCDKRFAVRQNLQYHQMSSHGDKKNYACDICNKSFANPRSLYTHRALHLGKRYLCQDCGFRARSSANLRGHVKAKHEAKQYCCKDCGRKFSSGNNLKNHMRVHTGESPYNCDLCGVKFKRVHHLHSHIESKLHIETMDKVRRKGVQVPRHLDPLRRARGRQIVEDGPVTLAKTTQHPVHITEVNDEGWPLHQVVVVEENVGDFSIPVDQAQIEIIQEPVDENNESLILSV